MVTDRVGDLIVRLQNAALIGKEFVLVPYSSHLFSILNKLKDLGFLTSVKVQNKGASEIKKEIIAEIFYDEKGHPKLRGVKRISKPGRRLYVPHTEAHRVKGGTGIRLISSSAGILSDKEARKARVGGENLFEIW